VPWRIGKVKKKKQLYEEDFFLESISALVIIEVQPATRHPLEKRFEKQSAIFPFFSKSQFKKYFIFEEPFSSLQQL